MSKLPRVLDGLTSIMDTQLDKVRDICLYRFYLMMLEAGWMKMLGTLPGDEGAICVFGMAA